MDRVFTRFPCRTVALLMAGSFVLAVATVAQHSTRLKATHVEGTAIGRSVSTKLKELTAFCMDGSGNILACDGKAHVIKVITPRDTLVATWKPGFAPKAIVCAPDGCAYVGGDTALARLDSHGKVVARHRGHPFTDDIASIAVSDEYVFAAGRSNLGYAVYRMKRDLTGGKQIVDGLSGCCGQMDICWHGNSLWVAENGRKRLVAYSPTGKEQRSWTKDGDEVVVSNFSGCCNPKNLCNGPDNLVLTSESEIGRVKAYTRSGELIQVLGTVRAQQGCVRVTVGSNADASRVYVLDGETQLIRVLVGPSLKAVRPGNAVRRQTTVRSAVNQ